MGKTDENELLKTALQYHERGWCIIPIPHGKKAARIKWGRYQKDRPDEKQLQKWFGGNSKNIAVVLGKVSNGLACRDFDTEQAYQRWAGEHRDLAGKLPTVRTARGYHVYFLADVGGIRHFDDDDGELRGGGGYCLLPPSVHPDGMIYEWLIEPNGENLLSLNPDIFLSSSVSVTEKTEQTEKTEKTEKTQENSSNREKKENLRASFCDFDKVIERTLPQKVGTRNRKVFELARALRSLPEYFDAHPKFFEQVVREWHRRALPNIRTQDFEESWIDFLKAWPKIRWKIGENPMSETFEKAKRVSDPDCAAKYDNPKLRLLVAWCKELQVRAGDGSFFLSARTAGKYLDVEPMTANRWLFLLEQDKVLEVVEKGKLTRAGGIATRFRYVAN